MVIYPGHIAGRPLLLCLRGCPSNLEPSNLEPCDWVAWRFHRLSGVLAGPHLQKSLCPLYGKAETGSLAITARIVVIVARERALVEWACQQG